MDEVAPIRIRVAACVCDGEKLLLVTHEKMGRTYKLLPGGGVEVGETLEGALTRELLEETGYEVAVGRPILICETIEPGNPTGRHILHLIFSASVIGGSLRPGHDDTLRDAGWWPKSDLVTSALYPDIGALILAAWDQGFTGEVRSVGNVWRD